MIFIRLKEKKSLPAMGMDSTNLEKIRTTKSRIAITRFPLFLLYTFELPTDTFKVKTLLTIVDTLCKTDASQTPKGQSQY
jgi:hypothetical protein